MNLQEFSDGFTTLLNSYGSHFEFGEQSSNREVILNEYEKSFFLTKAQEELVISLYSGKNTSGDTFEGTEEMRRYLSPLVKTEEASRPGSIDNAMGIGDSSFFQLMDDLMFITYEWVKLEDGKGKCDGMTTMDVYPVTQDEYHKIKRNPFRGPNDRRALRLDVGGNTVEIICKYPVDKYFVRYIKRPKPIILINLPDGLTINGEDTKSDEDNPCELDASLHQKILDLAVRMALQIKSPSLGPTEAKKKPHN